jgi:hypothetical protein
LHHKVIFIEKECDMPTNVPFLVRVEAKPIELLNSEGENSLYWSRHFRENALHQIAIPWDRPQLPIPHRDILIRSIQDFQLGESSEGKHGKARAKSYAERVGDPHYLEAMSLFFDEENRHAAYLERFMALHDAEPIRHSWTDFIFRRLRRMMGLELLITALLTAELIGEVYYRALFNATECPTLRRLCTQILRDEHQHIRFHIERYKLLDGGKKWKHWRRHSWWPGLFATACLAVWSKHHRAFRAGGYTFAKFWKEAWEGYRRVKSSPRTRKDV